MSKITMAHGAGGSVMQRLIKEKMLKYFGNGEAEVSLAALDDAAVVEGIVFTTDSHTVKPIFFPGGDIGRLSVAGTVNDLACVGGRPLALSAAFVIEEGFDEAKLEMILQSMASTADEAGVRIVTGDTKVVEKGSLSEIVVNTSGIGRRHELLDANLEIARRFRDVKKNWLLDSNVADGDVIIVSGYVGDHGTAVLSAREGIGFEGNFVSDVMPLNKMLEKALGVGGICAVKDATRGGIANLLNEWSEKSSVGIVVEEEKIPVREEVRAACSMLGIDPYEIGNEGRVVLAVVPEMAQQVVEALHETKEGKDATIIGQARKDIDGVVLRTKVGGLRVLQPPVGDPVPRIC
ncbi:MAG: hydrogenase expression/formation protein HypE [Thermoplasmata archaeon]|nr:hydrogenase expression/formation protein HypE [Thermoplasmata archaeon]